MANYTDAAEFKIPRHIVLKGGVNIETIGGNVALTYRDSMLQHLNASIGGLEVTLPANKEGAVFVIHCIGNAIMVKKPDGANIKSLSVDEGALFGCDGTIWKQFL